MTDFGLGTRMGRVLGLMLVLALAAASPAGLAAEDELLPRATRGQVPPGYAPSYATTVAAAEDEARLVIYSTTDLRVATSLIDDFRSMYPRVDVRYEDLNSTVLHHRFIAEAELGVDSADESEARSGSADVVWSSAMDQQAVLVSKGYALTYDSPESANLPEWAKWRSQAYATTYEPIAIVYNKSLLPADQVPQSHADLVRLLNADRNRFSGKVATYDVEKSGVGFFLATQDAAASQGFWDIARALHRVEVRLELTTDAMVKRVASGQALLAYNVLGSYALAEAQKNASLGIVFPRDYTLVSSRIVFINKRAAHPNAARLWVDYLLSKRGQAVIANNARLFAVRADVDGETTAAHLTEVLGASIRPIAIGPGLVGYQDNQSYVEFIQRLRRSETAP